MSPNDERPSVRRLGAAIVGVGLAALAGVLLWSTLTGPEGEPSPAPFAPRDACATFLDAPAEETAEWIEAQDDPTLREAYVGLLLPSLRSEHVALRPALDDLRRDLEAERWTRAVAHAAALDREVAEVCPDAGG